MEQYFTNKGYFFPSFPPAAYWIGYQLNSSSGNWSVMDLLQPNLEVYNAWGM